MIQEKYFGFKPDKKIVPDMCDICSSFEYVNTITEFETKFFPELNEIMYCCRKCLQEKYQNINISWGE